MNQNTILVIEDDPDICSAFQLLLELENYAVLTASNGLEALELLNSLDHLPSLIILDLMMPVMDGWEFARIKNANPRCAGIPVVVTTAMGAGRGELEAEAHLRKPVDIDRLLDTVARFCIREAS